MLDSHEYEVEEVDSISEELTCGTLSHIKPSKVTRDSVRASNVIICFAEASQKLSG